MCSKNPNIAIQKPEPVNNDFYSNPGVHGPIHPDFAYEIASQRLTATSMFVGPITNAAKE